MVETCGCDKVRWEYSLMGERVLNVKKTNCLVVICGMMFAGIIRMIVDAAAPEIEELTLCVAAFEPMEAWIH